MRRQIATLCALLTAAVTSVALVAEPGGASPADAYIGPYYGEGNLPPGCIRDFNPANPANTCYHMATGINPLDSPIIDVAVLVPASPTAERDLRIMRQAVQMWEGGIDYLSGEMGLGWLHDGVKFHITPSIVDLTAGDVGSTYPLYDPEIVVLATNPVGAAAGIGTDPANYLQSLGIMDADGMPCHNIANPFATETWQGMPGYDGHHGDNGGIYTEDCGGAGGNVCFAINSDVDAQPGTPTTPVVRTWQLFDLVAHEFGHCLSVGHVGDGAEGKWGPVPVHDIMAYHLELADHQKCVSTLDVEGFAIRMSRYLDVNADGAINVADRLLPNDAVGNGLNPFQVQNPADHLYASGTGSPQDCPQPDLGLLPGEPTDWTPEPVDTSAILANKQTLTGL